MPVTIIPKPTNIIIDKISLTYPVPESEQESVVVNGELLINNGYSKKGKYSEIYERSILCLVGDYNCTLYINYSPRKPYKQTHNFIRVEFNANNAKIMEVKQILDMLLINGHARILSKGKITSVELATDIHYLSIDQLFIDYPKFIKGNLYYSCDNIETINLGSIKSDKNLKAYNKTLQLSVYNKPHKTGLFNDITRIEYTLTNCNIKLQELPSTTNMFNNIKIAAYPKHYIETDFQLASFLILCSAVGYSHAIKKVKKNNAYIAKQIEYKIMTNGIKNWWYPDKIWNGVKLSIDKLLLK